MQVYELDAKGVPCDQCIEGCFWETHKKWCL